MDSKLGIPLIVAAVILGASVVVGSLILQSSLDRATEELTGVKTALAEIPGAVREAAPAAPPARVARRGPDPNRRYTLNLKGAPAKGPATAKVKLVEFSDFQ